MLSIIVPCYNGARYIQKGNIDKIVAYMDSTSIDYEVIIVNDGSTDNSLELLNLINNSKVRIISYDINRGKGYAIKTGIQNAKYDILFMDIDLSTDLKSIELILNNQDNFDIIIGSRKHADSVVHKTTKRNLMSACCNLVVRICTGIKYRDTQCGFKFIKHNYAQEFAEIQVCNRWTFDVEYLSLAKKRGLRVLEIPVLWDTAESTTVIPLKSSVNFIAELFKMKLKGH